MVRSVLGTQVFNNKTLAFETFVKMKSQGGTGDRHAKKYFNNKRYANNSYMLASANNVLRANTGTLVSVLSSPTKSDGQWQVDILCFDTKLTVPLHQLFKPRPAQNMLYAEDNAFDKLSSQIDGIKNKTSQKFVTIKVPSGETLKISSLAKVYGFRKADFNLLGFYCLDNIGTPVYFISHKKGPLPGDYVSYGSLGGHKNHPVISYFVEKCKPLVKDNHPIGESYALELNPENETHRDLILKMLYGDHYGSKYFCADNVHAIFYGNMWLEPKGKHYVLKVDRYLLNGEIPNYKLLIQSTRTEDRHDVGLRNTRLLLRREGSRKVTTYV